MVSVAGVLITGHLLSATVACYTAVRKGYYRLAIGLVLVPLVFALAVPHALIARAPHPETTVTESAVMVLVPALLGCLANVNQRMSRLTAERQAQQALLQESRLREAALQQRERLVRDIHNGVGRQVTLMVLQAGAIAVSAGASVPIKERCQLITDAGRDAVKALREIVTLVQTPDPGNTPPPEVHTLSDLGPLIRRYRDGGQKITVDLHIDPTPPESATQDLAYKVVEEGLSNAVRHASGAAVDVGITQTRTALVTKIRNGAPALGSTPLPGTGHGLAWLREEVQAAGGTLHAAAEPDGGFLLEARLPTAHQDVS
jgi:signal transduction histidine kinase